MIIFSESLKVWDTSAFNDTLKSEIAKLEPHLLPLQQGLSHGSYVSDSQHAAIIIGVSEESENIIVRAGIFYSSIIAGCSCADDPTPIDEQAEYCELQFSINRKTSEATVKLLN